MAAAGVKAAAGGARKEAQLADDALVVFTPSGKRGRFPLDTSVLECARRLGVDLDSVCGGRGLCGRCQIILSEGAFAKHGIESRRDHLTAVGEVERGYARRRGLKPARRPRLPDAASRRRGRRRPRGQPGHKQVVRKRAEVRAIRLDPAIRLHYVEVAPPDMANPMGDLERLLLALREQWSIEALEQCDLRTLHRLQKALRDGDWTVTVAVHRGQRITAIWPGFHDRAYGIAFDVGSTTVAAHLCHLSTGEVVASSGIMNPQIRFGEDLMSRVSYVMMNKGGAAEMTKAVRDAINRLIVEVTYEAGLKRTDVLNATFVGNPIMLHLLMGIDPTELGGAPFALASNAGHTYWATELGVKMHPDARVYVLPSIAGHVGADAAGMILSEGPHLSDEIMLLVDVGTNAEIVLGNKDRLLAASSPTGPAFEGAQISSGQRAAPGAIERMRIDPATLEPRFKVVGSDLWSDADGFADAIRYTGITGICGSGIIEALGEMVLAGLLLSDGTIDGAMAGRSPRVQRDGRTFSYLVHEGEPEIRVTQNDVRAIQLAKAALYAGARLLMDRLGVERVDRIVLTGAFGSHIDVTYAMLLGMIPDCDLAKVFSAGNAAGTGARIALLDQRARDEIEEVVARVEKVETALEPRFQEHFVEAMAIPHAAHPFPNLARAVTLPKANVVPFPSGDGRASGRRRRRRRARAS